MIHQLSAREHRWFRPRSRSGYLGAVGVSRLLVFEVVQVCLFLVLIQRLWAAILGGLVGALAVVATFGRTGGRWWSEHLMLWLRFRLRRGAVDDKTDDRRLALLRELVPDLIVEDVADRDDTRFGMGGDGAGWFAVLEIDVADEDAVRPPLPLSAMAAIAAEAEQTGVVMQVVALATSDATQADGRRHRLWVTVRLDAQAVAESVIDDPDAAVEVPGVLREIVRRVGRVLRRRRLRSTALDVDGLIDALVHCTDLVPDTPVGTVGEDWDRWRSSRLSHGCCWLRSWPDAERGPGLLAALREFPAPLVSLVIQLEPRHEGTDLRCLVHVAEADSDYPAAVEGLLRLARRAGGELVPLNGEHAMAVYSAAPTGGGAR